MNSEFKLAMQLTMVDFLSGAATAAKRKILDLGAAGKEVARDFDIMQSHITKGLKAVAVASYSINKLKPGIANAAGMQEATLDVKMNLKESGQNAGELARQLATVRAVATDIQKDMPFGGQEVMGIENVLLKAGLKMDDVTAKGGAAWAAAALATISKESPQGMGEGLIAMASPFNIRGGQFAELANFIAKVDQASVTTIPEIVEGMKYVSGTASNMKVSWQQTLIAMGAMSQQGLRGSMAGTSLNDFLIRMVGTSREERRVIAALNTHLISKGKEPLKFFDDGGKLRELPAIINNIRTSLSGLTDKQRMFALQKIFGEQGARAAFALIKTGAGSWEEVSQGVSKAADMTEKLNIRMEGFSANLKSLQGTSKTTAASIFDPWLAPLNEITRKFNDVMIASGKFATTHPKTTTAVNGVAAAGLAAVAAYAGFQLIKGGAAGLKVMKGLKGLGGTALGVAEGKMLEAAAGVQPVFVTNAADIAQGSSLLEKGAEGLGAAALARKVWTMAMSPTAKGASYLPMLLSRGGLVGLAAGGGYLGGMGLNWGLNAGTHALTGANDFGSWLYDKRNPEKFDMRYESAVSNANDRKGNPINLMVQIDSQGRIISRSNDMSTSINTMKRGAFFDELFSPSY